MSVELKQRKTLAKAPRARAPSIVPPWKIKAARAALLFERLWPIVLPAAAPVFVIVVLGLFGVSSRVPSALHGAALCLALLASGFAVWFFGRTFKAPTHEQALARLEADGFLDHAPLRAIEDEPFAGDASPLWKAHLDEMARKASSAKLSGPRATVDRLDPFALRYGAIGLLAIALVVAGPDWSRRLGATFRPTGLGGDAIAAAADLWVEPPDYSGRAPIHLLRRGDPIGGERQQINVPQGSTIMAQISGGKKARLAFSLEDETKVAALDETQPGRLTLTVDRSGLLRLKVGRAEGRWPIGALPDNPPTAYFIDNPSAGRDQRLAIAANLEDDYAIASARLELRLDPDQERPLDSPGFDAAAIGERRRIELDGVAGKTGERRFEVDLQSDPWADLEVYLKLVAVDGAGQEGATQETKTRLPARAFFNPLAKAVIEQRQTLAVAAEDWRRAGRSFDALTLAPDRFYEKATDYLLMRTAFWRVMRQDGEGFKEAVDEFWPLALQLEDEALELARQRLEAAHQKLREALERNAGDEEIARLVEDLRAAMQQYLQAMQEAGERMAEETGAPSETLDAAELEGMLNAIRDLSKSGAKGAAQQALSDLENILRNLRMSGAGGEGKGGKSGQGGLAGQAGDLIGRQRDLANKTFERAQSEGASGGDLAQEEGGLAGELSKLLESLDGAEEGADPDDKAKRALREALGQMRGAEDALDGDNFDAAGAAMERAIANLREGAGALAKAQKGMQAGDPSGEGRGGRSVDPLGRPYGETSGRDVGVPEGSDPQRAREILQELRRRLSDGKRSEDEIRYLERLLERF